MTHIVSICVGLQHQIFKQLPSYKELQESQQRRGHVHVQPRDSCEIMNDRGGWVT